MLRCREVTRLYASDAVQAAPLMTRLAVRLHLLACRHCRRYVRELARIAEALRAIADGPAEDPARNEAMVTQILGDSAPPPA